ncbi:hypothetical protein BDB00DRAFT_244002 [Zychaea mexicana]|uniref:uncharacterized protein n=1 Tax=Zychaea mexicana TaxID=64656 RepID=UPI0022FEFE2A|nr:uncharacterized protein BDB00DRAFT_244002 [Zychaea mexicana]KAI9495349.1 hypothetical protein BDB00DRAFT_244002 [Zychaea mexicana]
MCMPPVCVCVFYMIFLCSACVAVPALSSFFHSLKKRRSPTFSLLSFIFAIDDYSQCHYRIFSNNNNSNDYCGTNPTHTRSKSIPSQDNNSRRFTHHPLLSLTHSIR